MKLAKLTSGLMAALLVGAVSIACSNSSPASTPTAQLSPANTARADSNGDVTTEPGGPRIPAASIASNSRLYVNFADVDDPQTPIRNGSPIELGDGLVAELFVDPYPTNTLTAWLDVYLRDMENNPVTDAGVTIHYDMYSMGHGPYESLAESSVNGHYLFRLEYIMYGAWEQVLQVDMGDDDPKQMNVIIAAAP